MDREIRDWQVDILDINDSDSMVDGFHDDFARQRLPSIGQAKRLPSSFAAKIVRFAHQDTQESDLQIQVVPSQWPPFRPFPRHFRAQAEWLGVTISDENENKSQVKRLRRVIVSLGPTILLPAASTSSSRTIVIKKEIRRSCQFPKWNEPLVSFGVLKIY